MKALRLWGEPARLSDDRPLILFKTRSLGERDVDVTPMSVIDMRDPRALAVQIDAAVGNAGDWSYSNKPTTEEITRAVMDSLGLSPRQRKVRR